MDKSPSVPNVDDLRLDDSGVDDLFASPEQPRDQKLNPDGRLNSESKLRNPQKSYDDADSREARLRQELENVRRVNRVIEDAVASLEKAKGNMDTVSRTVANASTLLNTWTRILSQTEHNQRLILNPAWHGATQDLAEAESDALARQQHQQHAERREREEQQRRQEAARRKADEQEAESQRKEAQAGRGTRGTRGGRRTGSARASSSATGPGSRAGYVGVGGQGGRGARGASARAGSGIGRGTSTSRGRTKG